MNLTLLGLLLCATCGGLVEPWSGVRGASQPPVGQGLSSNPVTFPPRTRGQLVVKRGRTAYLHPRELGRDPEQGWSPQNPENCKVQVVHNDPMTQRVGRMTPLVFNCDFLPNAVKYTHYGSPLLDEDDVKLQVFHFTENATFTHFVHISVRIINAKYEMFVHDPRLRQLEVPEFFGLSNPIDPSVLRFRYNYYDGATCTVRFSRLDAVYPMFGQIVRGRNFNVVDVLSHDCRDFLYLGLRYRHLAPPTPDVDYLPLAVEVSDPSKGEDPVREYVYLPIRIRGALPNTPPKASFINSYLMEVDEFVITTIDPEVISAKDAETPDEQLVFNISTYPQPGDGYFVHLEDHTLPILSFLQADLINHNIAYHPPNSSVFERRIITAEFTVYDSEFVPSLPIPLSIALKPSATRGPQVAINNGLTLVEGQQRTITTENLMIVDKDNPQDVRVYVKSGLRHGRLEVNGVPSVMFSLDDVELGRVVYIHDDSDSQEDRLTMRISDPTYSIYTKFPIHILPKDDSPPYLVNNVGLEVPENGYVQITENQLSAHDKDSDDEHILYLIKMQPEAGQIVRKYRPTTSGHPVSKFSQVELTQGLIFYHHTDKNRKTDSFEFRLIDENDPPNKSGKYGVTIVINSVDDLPPQLVGGSSRQVMVRETEIAIITKENLQYTDLESDDSNLLYTITNQPFFLTTTITVDAGRIISVDNMTSVAKDPGIPAIHTFKQSQINHLKIAYMPPIEDIGPIRRHARFLFTVSDSMGNKVIDQPFDITILPVNNQMPHMAVRRLSVEEGGSVRISTNDISSYDPDTDQDELRFTLEMSPRYGRLLREGMVMASSEYFSILDLIRPSITYVHDGSESLVDVFTLSVSDGLNKITKDVYVDVNLINDQDPEPVRNLHSSIQVMEGGSVLLTSANVAATDNDTDDHLLNFIVIQSPHYGEIRVNGKPASQFSQAQVWNRAVTYVHTSGEIGADLVRDFVTFAITDQTFGGMADHPIIKLNFTIAPVDNQPPYVILGSPLFVTEGRKAPITQESLSAQDVDTSGNDLKFFLNKAPDWGYLENNEQDPGAEKTEQGKPVTSFTWRNIQDHVINYVQANHTKVEPLADTFEVYVTDGKQTSAPSALQITVVPSNDEPPSITIASLNVEEAGEISMGSREIIVTDRDLPKQRLVVSVASQPMHGRLSLMTRAVDQPGMVEIPMHDITAEDLLDMVRLVYQHDGSESLHDKFTLQVSDGTYTSKATASVDIKALSDEQPGISHNRRLVVNNGETALLNDIVLQTYGIQIDENRLQYLIVTAPKQGLLQRLQPSEEDRSKLIWFNIKEGMNFSQEDVKEGRIRYAHTWGLSRSSRDEFIFQVTDGRKKHPLETFAIEIMNVKPKDIGLLSKVMKVTEGDSKVINTELLSAYDDTAKPQELLFTITRPSTQGHLAMITGKNVSITSFTQLDLATQKVIYTHTSKADIGEDLFYFQIRNAVNVTKDGSFKVQITSIDKELPTLAANVPLTVVQGDQAVLTGQNLLVTDPDTPASNLTYIITEPPQHGALMREGQRISDMFTQHDVDLGYVTYASDRADDAGMDFFLFLISDSHHQGYLINNTLESAPAFFNILIQPLAKEPPRLTVNHKPRMLESLGNGKYGFILSNQHLAASHPLSDDQRIVYTMLTKAQHGYIENLENGRVLKKRFRQMDLDEARIAYVLNDDTHASNDSFTFRVQDSKRNTLDNQKFELEWSVIELAQTQYVVCEDAESLTLAIRRTGALGESSFVEIETKPLSATQGIDYAPSTITKIQFDPGQTVAVWDVSIAEDSDAEGNEKFRVMLKNPVNAILGSRDKANVQIVNLNIGGCDEYIGMISKNQPENIGGLVDPSLRKQAYDIVEEVQGSNEPKEDEEPMIDLSKLDHDAVKDVFDLSQLAAATNNGEEEDEEEDEDEDDHKRGRKGRKGRGRKRRRKNRGKNKEEQEVGYGVAQDLNDANIFDSSITSQLAPQPCDKDTKGLLYFDLRTSRMFRCDGIQWGEWDKMHNRMFNTQPKNTSPLPEVDPEEEEDETGSLQDLQEMVLQEEERQENKREKKERQQIAEGSQEDRDWWDREQERQSAWDVPCPPGWEKYRDDCYKAIMSTVTWDDAERRCRDYGGHLAHVESAKHLTWIRKLIKTGTFWIGLNDKRLDHVWEYTSGGPVRFYHWRKGFPRRQPSLQKHCVLVAKRLEWVNRPCDKNTANYVCTKPLHNSVTRVNVNSRRRRRRRRERDLTQVD